MRSRYSGYAKQNADYLIKTWHSSCQAERFRASLIESFAPIRWLSLQIIETEMPVVKPEGFVTFFARFSENGQEGFIHERSRFLREEQRWYYVDGTYPVIGRNDRCPCGSGKKFKKCCGQ